ncbi:MAG: hypothetical protein V9G24_12665 [Rhodoblastus sp.]|jgi:hypothetical protein
MVRPELHENRRMPDALSRPPARPRLDAVAWNAARALDRDIALLREKLAEAGREPSNVRNGEKAA